MASTPINPPAELGDEQVAGVVAIAQSPLQGPDIFDHHGNEPDVEHRCRETFVFEDPRTRLEGRSHQSFRILLEDDLFHSTLVRTVGIRVEKTDRDRADTAAAQDSGNLARLGVVYRGAYLTRAEDALVDLETVPLANDRGPRRLVVDVPDVFFRASCGLGEKAGEPLGGDHRHPGQPAFDQRVRAEGGAVSERIDLAPVNTGHSHRIEYSGEPVGSGRCLDDVKAAVCVGHYPIGEGAAYVYANSIHRGSDPQVGLPYKITVEHLVGGAAFDDAARLQYICTLRKIEP